MLYLTLAAFVVIVGLIVFNWRIQKYDSTRYEDLASDEYHEQIIGRMEGRK